MKSEWGLGVVMGGVLILIRVLMGPDRGSEQKQPASLEPSSVAAQWKLPEGVTAEDYLERDTCAGCHAPQAKQFAKTVHAGVGNSSEVKGGCQTCHGPGKAHAEAQMEAIGDEAKTEAAKKLIFSFKGKPEENSERCLDCHATSKGQAHYESSTHKMAGVTCGECHSAHLLVPTDPPVRTSPPSAQAQMFRKPRLREETRWLNESMLTKSQPALCFDCHGTVQTQFALPTHHRVPEGLMKCTDCHNAHGTFNQPMLKKANWEVCVSCHIEKRGPFVFEHAAVKIEGCVVCHSPHGTVTRNLLVRREGRFTCLECHVEPQAPNVPHGRFGFATLGECVRCHATIHGSNFSPFFLH